MVNIKNNKSIRIPGKGMSTILTIVAILFTGYKKDLLPVDNDTISVSMKNSDTYTFLIGFGGDEECAKFIRKSQHHQKSALRRIESRNWQVNNDYMPKQNFAGQAFVEIKAYGSAKGSVAPATMKTLKSLITVTI